MKRLILPLMLAAFLYGCTGIAEKSTPTQSPVVRVYLSEGRDFSISTSGGYMVSLPARREVGEGRIFISLSNRFIFVNDIPVDAESLEIAPGDHFTFGGKNYRGNLLFIRKNDTLMAINSIDVESYLWGVVPLEIPPRWQPDTLKAQAVAARTYVMYEMSMSRKAGRPFDVYPDTRSQVYGGMDAEDSNTTLAVNITAGLVLRYEGRIIPAYFHSSSGGMTESALDFLGDDRPYLKAVESRYCEIYSGNRWELFLKNDEFLKSFPVLSSNGLSNLTVTERTESKRIRTLAVIGTNSLTNLLSGKELRNTIGPVRMKSTRANIRLTNDGVLIYGVGYGHGMGMGQWDAEGMARQNIGFLAILSYFYRGAVAEKIW